MIQSLFRLPVMASMLCVTGGTALAAPATISYHEPLAELRFEQGQSSARVAAAGSPLTAIHFRALGRPFDLSLEPNERLLEHLKPAHRPTGDALAVYRGTLGNQPGSWVRVSVLHGALHALIWDSNELYAVAPVDGVRALIPGIPGEARDPVIFRWRDVSVRWHDELLANGSSYDRTIADLDSAVAAAPLARRLSVGLVGDVEFALTTVDPDADMLARMNLVEGIYADQVHLVLEIDEIVQYTREPDPFSTALAEDLLSALADYRASTPALRALGTTHLFTGRDLEGNDDETGQVLGVAYLASVCDGRLAVSLTQAAFDPSMDAVFIAHEIGHTLGAPHDAEPGSACAATPPGFLMDPFPESTEFSLCSLEQMERVISNASCITPVSDGDVALSVSAPATVLLGDTASIVLRVENNGAQPVFGVHLDSAFDARTELGDDAYSGIAQNCDVYVDGMNCVFPSLDAHSSVDVPIKLHGIGTGPAVEHFTIRSANDANPSNDTVDYTLTVQRAVKFVADVPQADVIVSRSIGGYQFFAFENANPIQATHVDVQVTSDFPLARVDATGGTCLNYTPHVSTTVTCHIPSIPVGLNTILSFQIDAPVGLGADEERRGHLWVKLDAAEPVALSSDSKVHLNLDARGTVADLGVTVVDFPTAFDESESAHLTLEMRNFGPDDAPATLTLSFPPLFSASNVIDSQGACAEGETPEELVCDHPSLAAGSDFNIDLDVASRLPGTFDWQVSVTSAAFDDDLLDNTASLHTTVTGEPPPPPPPPDDPGSGSSGGGSSAGNGGGGGGGGASTFLIALGFLALKLRNRTLRES